MAGQLLQESLDLLDSSALTGQDTRMEKANALMALGSIAERSDYREAGRLYEKALGLYQEVEDNRGTVKALLSMGSAALNLGHCAESKLSTEESLTVYRALGDQRGIETAIRTLGWIALCQGELETAERLQRESLAIALELNHQPDIAGTLRTLGAVLVS